MRKEHLKYIICPKTYRTLFLDVEQVENGRIKTGTLIERISGNKYPIINFIPRFVPIENYSASFGFEWNIHSRTQYDDVSKFPQSKERFEKETRWPANLAGEVILEVGSGSGRFTKAAAETKAMIVSFDYSRAVEANYKSNGFKDNVLIVQANVYEMPFPQGFFDKAFCFGVLQHTPNPRDAFLSIVKFLKHGGKIASDVYAKNLIRWLLHTKYYVRPFTRGRNPEKLYKWIVKYVDFMWPLVRLIRRIPEIGYAINWRLLVADYSKTLLNADEATLKQWAYLDTFDMLSPMYDYPQTLRTFRSWHEAAGLTDIDVHYGYNGVEGRATKP